MLWVVSGNLNHEEGLKTFIHLLDRYQLEYMLVKPIQYTLSFVSYDFDSFSRDHTANDEPFVDPSKDIMVIGSYTLAKIAKHRGWKPGSFLENLTHSHWKEGWGEEFLLNGQAITSSVKNIEVPNGWNKFFARPLEDTKSFSGTIFEKENFNYWKESILKVNEKLSLHEDTEIIIAPLKNIQQECRFFVIDGKIVTGSMYKLRDNVLYSEVHDTDIINFAQKMIDKWQPNQAFCLDIARTDEGFKIIEVNNINSSGFYASDLSKIIFALENLKIERKETPNLKARI